MELQNDKLIQFIKEQVITPIPLIQHVGIENRLFFAAFTPDIDNIVQAFLPFPHVELLKAEEQLFGIIDLPKIWVYDFLKTLANMQLEGLELVCVPASLKTVYNPWKSLKFYNTFKKY